MTDIRQFRLQLLVLPQRTKHVINTLNSSATLYDLQREIETLTKLSIPQQHLTTGFPPKPIDTKANDAKTTALGDLGIRHGDTVEVRNAKDISDTTVQKGTGTGLLNSNASNTTTPDKSTPNGVDRIQSNTGATSSTATIARDSTPEKAQPTIIPLNTTAPTNKTNGTTAQTQSSTYTSPDGWNCPACTLFNLNARSTCAACDTPNPTASTQSYPTSTAQTSNGFTSPTPTGITPDTIDEATVWNCDKCTYANTITVPRCRACNARNPHFEAVRDPEAAVEDQLIGGPADRRSDDWECTRCRARNSNYDMSCNTCRASRLLSLPINTRAPPTHNPVTTVTNADGTTTRQSRFSRFVPSGPTTFFRGKDPYTCPNCSTLQQRQVIRCKTCGSINTQRIANRAAQSQAMSQQGGGGGMPMMMPMCSIM